MYPWRSSSSSSSLSSFSQFKAIQYFVTLNICSKVVDFRYQNEICCYAFRFVELKWIFWGRTSEWEQASLRDKLYIDNSILSWWYKIYVYVYVCVLMCEWTTSADDVQIAIENSVYANCTMSLDQRSITSVSSIFALSAHKKSTTTLALSHFTKTMQLKTFTFA